MRCLFNPSFIAASLLHTTAAFAGHAGEMESPGLLPHELLIDLVGLASVVLLALLALAWVVWRVLRLERRLRDLEGGRKT